MKRARFGVAFDVDGVLLRGSKLLPGAISALRTVQEKRIPHLVVTNGGGVTEADFAERLHQLGLPRIAPEQVVLAHTPVKRMAAGLRDELVVVFGRKMPVRAAHAYGLRFAVTPEQYCSVHNLFPFESYDEPLSEELREAIATRPVAAALVFTDPIVWGRDIQLIVDLAAPEMAVGGLPKRTSPLRVVFAQNDFLWSHSFPHPRFGQGAFNLAASVLYQRLYGRELAAEVLGKPTAATMSYCREELKEPLTAYMIGDNQHSDILGGKQPGWKSVLVQSGLYRAGDPFEVEPDYCVAGVEEAVKLICEIEKD
jgi:HAD superfamily hydrolase (TIGR01456 family)